MPRTTPQYEQDQRKRILDGAARVFAGHGYEKTTVDHICQALHLSKGAIYLYFKSKEELFVSVLQSIFDRRFTDLSTAYQADDPILIKFEKILERLGMMMSDDDAIFIRLWLEGYFKSEHIPGLQAIKTDSRQQFHRLLYGLLEEGARAGEIKANLNLSNIAYAMMAISDGLMLHSLVRSWGIDSERVRNILQDSFAQLLVHAPDSYSQSQIPDPR